MPNYKDDRIISYGHLIAAYSEVHRKVCHSIQEEAGLPSPWFEILLLIAQSEEGHLKMTEVADHVLLTTGGITRLVDRMVEDNLVLRVPCPTDRRIQWVVLTDHGRARLDKAIEYHLVDLDNYYLGPFTSSEFEQFNNMIEKLRIFNLDKKSKK